MYIRWGSDFWFILFSPGDSGDAAPAPLRVASLDVDLELIGVKVLSEPFTGRAEDAVPHLMAAVHEDARYVATGQLIPPCDDHHDRLGYAEHELHLALEAEFESHDLRFLGHNLANATCWATTGPRMRYASYPGYEELPVPISIRGPHSFDCSCIACDNTHFRHRHHGSPCTLSCTSEDHEDDLVYGVAEELRGDAGFRSR